MQPPRQIDGAIHPDVQQFSQDMYALKRKIEEYKALNEKKNAPGAGDAVKSQVNLKLRVELKNVDEMFRNAYGKIAKFEDDLKKYNLVPQNIQLFRQNLNMLEKIKRAIFFDVGGQTQNTLRGTAVKISRMDETEQQRNMTTTQIVDSNDRALERQNKIIDQIGHAVTEVNIASREMNDQLIKSNAKLADIGVEMEYTNQNIQARTNQINKVSRLSKKHKTFIMGVVNVILAAALGLILYYGIKSLTNKTPSNSNEEQTTE